MSNGNPTDPPNLPVPTGEVLMEAVAAGPGACRARSDTFLSWAPEQAVPQIVMNAPDPLLVELIVGPDHIDPLISMLRRHYATVRERCPVPFADVERVWRIQRQWWLQFVVDAHEADAASGGGGVPSAPRSARVRSRASALSARRLYTPRRRLLSCNRPSGSAHV